MVKKRLVLVCIGLPLAIFVSRLGHGEANDVVVQRDDTVVTSDHLEMVSGDTENRFFFKDNVEVKGNQLYAKSDQMEVVASRGGKKSDDAAIGDIGAVDSITLQGNVVIKQAGREANADSAIIYPAKGEVLLKGNAVVFDGEGKVTGDEMILKRDERRAIVKGSEGNRPKVTLPGFQDMSFKDEAESKP